MRLAIRTVSGEVQSILLRQDVDAATWRSAPPDPSVIVRIGADARVRSVETSHEVLSSTDEITEQFASFLADVLQQEGAGIEYSEQEAMEEPPFPYDPEAIRVDTKQFNIGLINEMINEGDINLAPDFQRQFVWKDLGTRSRLIESIMLRIPLPVFYLAQERDGRFQVVDGLQRLTVINQFLSNDLRLRDLEYLTDEAGKIFKSEDPDRCIDQRYRKRILQTQILVNIIDPQTPSNVKFDIFKRINQGGRPLNAQEMRNCMSSPSTRGLISWLASSDEFMSATTGSVGTVRMQDHELVLRFLAFKMARLGSMAPYSGNMERYLDEAVDRLNRYPREHEELGEYFLRAMENSRHLFGDYAFRKCWPSDLQPWSRRRLINNSYFTTWSVALADYDVEQVKMLPSEALVEPLAETLERDDRFYDAVSIGTNDRRRLDYAFAVTEALCAGALL